MTCLETLTSMSSRSAGECAAGSTRLEGWMEDDEDDVEEAGEMWNMVGRGAVEWMSWDGPIYKGNRVGKRADDCVQCDRRSRSRANREPAQLAARPPRRPVCPPAYPIPASSRLCPFLIRCLLTARPDSTLTTHRPPSGARAHAPVCPSVPRQPASISSPGVTHDTQMFPRTHRPRLLSRASCAIAQNKNDK